MLNMNSIMSCKFNGVPLSDGNISKKIFEFNKLMEEHNDTSELNIITINGLYGYRSGVGGWLLNLLSLYLSKNNNPTLVQNFLNFVFRDEKNKILSNDFEIVSYYFSLINRCIPILNYCNWDPKSFLFRNNRTINMLSNITLPTFYDISSIYLSNPLFDSGCAIYSNKTPISTGFEKWKLWNNIKFNDTRFNKGILWAFYKENNSGILVMTLNLHSSESSLLYNMQIQQIINLKRTLEEQLSVGLTNYETYITGDFTTGFNFLSNVELKNSLHSLLDENLQLVDNKKDILNTHFILYSNNSKTHTSIGNVSFFDNEILNVNFQKNNDVKIDIVNETHIVNVLNEVKPEINEVKPEIKIEVKPEIISDYFDQKNKEQTSGEKACSPKDEWLVL